MIRIRQRFPLAVAALAALAASTPPAGLAAQAQRAGASAVDVSGMDRSVKPGDSFFRYANGTWLKTTDIPADRSAWSAAGVLDEATDRRTADLIREVARSNAPAGSDRQKIRDFYASFMDSTAIDAAGLEPLRPTLDSIAAIKDRTGLARFLGSTLRADIDLFNATNLYTENLFGLWVAQDLDDPAHYSPFLVQGGLGMPDRSYYLDSSAAIVSIREKYQPHVAAMLGLAGIPDAEAKAAAVVRLETRIAEAHWSRQATRDVIKGNNHWTRADFEGKAPGLDWAGYLDAAGLGRAERFVVWQPSAVSGISALAASEPLDVWKDYLTFHAIQSRAAVLPAAFVSESFAFFGPVVSGAQQQPDRWKRA